MDFHPSDISQFNPNRPTPDIKFTNVKITLRAIIRYCSLPENVNIPELQVVSEMARKELERQLS